MHYLVPMAYVGWWLWGVPHRRLGLADLGWALWRGRWSGEYPYPFLHVVAIGLAAVLRHAAMVAAGFLVFGGLLWFLDRQLPGRNGHRRRPQSTGCATSQSITRRTAARGRRCEG